MPLRYRITNVTMSRRLIIPMVMTAAFGYMLSGQKIFVQAEDPVRSAEQIQQDWLRQETLRVSPLEMVGSDPVARTNPGDVTVSEDALGGVDGIISGRWGFHTAEEADPWWQVDLGEVRRVGRIVIWNRCDSFADRAKSLAIAVSTDGKNFTEAWKNADQRVFYGQSDGQPLEVSFSDGSETVFGVAGIGARYVRISLNGTLYFHLDEVRIFGTDDPNRNLALGCDATQSSVSPWSTRHQHPVMNAEQAYPSTGTRWEKQYPIRRTLDRATMLFERLESEGVSLTDERMTLHALAEKYAILCGVVKNERVESITAESDVAECYFSLKELVRQTTLRKTPELAGFDDILFVKRATTLFPHMSDQHYGWFSRPGGGVYLLKQFRSDSPELVCLTESFPEGSFISLELSFDATKILFAWARYYEHVKDVADKTDRLNLPEDSFFHIFEMDLNDGVLRQLTFGRYDDFDPRYLSDGSIAFLSTRKGRSLQYTMTESDATRTDGNLPYSYVRCGGDAWRPVPVFTLHAMAPDGTLIRPLSAFENFEWSPQLHHDGRLLFARWDYIDRFNGHFESLWSTNQDGSNPQLVYGNYTVRPQAVFEARPIPGSDRLVFTASAHHSIYGGSFVLLDRSMGTEGEGPLTRVTPEVPFPETEAMVPHYYVHPFPLSENVFLCSWSDRPLPTHNYDTDETRNPVNATGIYCYDTTGNLELLYRDPQIGSAYPIAVRPRPVPPRPESFVDWNAAPEGTFFLRNVRNGLPETASSIRRLRVIGVIPKTQPLMNSPVIGVSAEDTGKTVLGSVPVAADGSAWFRAPAGIPLFFQALDENGVAVQTMRTLTSVMPSQTLSCIGCHENRDTSPETAVPGIMASIPMALQQSAPAQILTGPEGSLTLRYETLVQPVLDTRCVGCHSPAGQDPRRTAASAEFDLSSGKSYETLLGYRDRELFHLAYERDYSLPNGVVAAKSELWQFLTEPDPTHADLTLSSEERERLLIWMDTYVPRRGTFCDEQEAELETMRQRLEAIGTVVNISP